ncbi:uncharacterized protein CLUP02_09104 [Colletotrichum lupini]|uniref:Uncharacterized protein n=1 Tax=Colletotrichum lupini TaxID=145971 RepID=A0A9Q8SUB1_9PEZI|nr:uncharacterized protein CLUP02_09104 [Colletotrichum lupini]UQC83610.1 hypothetical protein CLUP02_09104 [Colletotrichum lupini]
MAQSLHKPLRWNLTIPVINSPESCYQHVSRVCNPTRSRSRSDFSPSPDSHPFSSIREQVPLRDIAGRNFELQSRENFSDDAPMRESTTLYRSELENLHFDPALVVRNSKPSRKAEKSLTPLRPPLQHVSNHILISPTRTQSFGTTEHSNIPGLGDRPLSIVQLLRPLSDCQVEKIKKSPSCMGNLFSRVTTYHAKDILPSLTLDFARPFASRPDHLSSSGGMTSSIQIAETPAAVKAFFPPAIRSIEPYISRFVTLWLLLLWNAACLLPVANGSTKTNGPHIKIVTKQIESGERGFRHPRLWLSTSSKVISTKRQIEIAYEAEDEQHRDEDYQAHQLVSQQKEPL